MTLLPRTLGYFARFLNPLKCCSFHSTGLLSANNRHVANGTTDTVLNTAVMSDSGVDFWVVTLCSYRRFGVNSRFHLQGRY